MLWWFAVAAICCNLATLWLLASWLLSRATPTNPIPAFSFRAIGSFAERNAIKVSAVIATAAMLGSLYLSEVAHFMPCRYCWMQRIAMYPLALVLLIAWFAKDNGVRRYAWPMSTIGLGFSAWHYLVQRFPDIEGSSSCDVFNPCTLTLTWKFHFISIPYMAGSAFALIATLMLINWRCPTAEWTGPAATGPVSADTVSPDAVSADTESQSTAA